MPTLQDLSCRRIGRSRLRPGVVHGSGAVKLDVWAREHVQWIEASLVDREALLLRGFDIRSAEDFEDAAQVLCGTLLEYVYRSTPRTSVAANVYTATEYRAQATIPLHNENAFQRDWPMRIAFCCLQPAATGGETPLARTGDVTARIDRALFERFSERGVMYVRNYGNGADLSWQTTFQSDSPREVERFCETASIEYEWTGEGRLRTRQICQGTAVHPAVGVPLWFNQAHLFHPWSLGPAQYEAMMRVFGEQDLPRNAFLGDGTTIDVEVLQHVASAFEQETIAWTWQRGDVLLVDNMLVSHGRTPYTGVRQVLVAMGEPYSARTAAAPHPIDGVTPLPAHADRV